MHPSHVCTGKTGTNVECERGPYFLGYYSVAKNAHAQFTLVVLQKGSRHSLRFSFILDCHASRDIIIMIDSDVKPYNIVFFYCCNINPIKSLYCYKLLIPFIIELVHSAVCICRDSADTMYGNLKNSQITDISFYIQSHSTLSSCKESIGSSALSQLIFL